MSTTAVKEMTPKEAYKLIEGMVNAAWTHQSDKVKEYATLNNLADRATPRTPIADEEGGVFWSRCPCCGEQVMEPGNFCAECGQAIRWEEGQE